MSDPTDLIREADAALAREAANEGGPIVDDPAALVCRLRDALAEACERRCTDFAREREWEEAAHRETEAALAEANATIAALREREETAGHIADVETFKAVEANAELVKAQEAIERVRHELELSEDRTDDYDAGVSTGMKAVLGRIRRAIEGPAT